MKQTNSKPNHTDQDSNKQKNRNSKSRRRRRRNPATKNQEKPSLPKQQTGKPVAQPEAPKAIPKRYGVVFYDTHQQAKEDSANLLEKAREVDQLNIVIRAEGTMDDPELLQYGKLYAGEAWSTIHQRRFEDGWYNEPH